MQTIHKDIRECLSIITENLLGLISIDVYGSKIHAIAKKDSDLDLVLVFEQLSEIDPIQIHETRFVLEKALEGPVGISVHAEEELQMSNFDDVLTF